MNLFVTSKVPIACKPFGHANAFILRFDQALDQNGKNIDLNSENMDRVNRYVILNSRKTRDAHHSHSHLKDSPCQISARDEKAVKLLRNAEQKTD